MDPFESQIQTSQAKTGSTIRKRTRFVFTLTFLILRVKKKQKSTTSSSKKRGKENPKEGFFWSKFNLTFKVNEKQSNETESETHTSENCFCGFCNCPQREIAQFEKWIDHFDELPIESLRLTNSNVVWCFLHATCRIAYKFGRLLAIESVKSGEDHILVDCLRSHNWKKFDIFRSKQNSIKIPQPNGKKARILIENSKAILECGVTWEDKEQLGKIFFNLRFYFNFLHEDFKNGRLLPDPSMFPYLQVKLLELGNLWRNRWPEHSTPYLHTIIAHTIQILDREKTISLFSQQAHEKQGDIMKIDFYRASSKNGGKGREITSLAQVFLKFYHVLIVYIWTTCPDSPTRTKVFGKLLQEFGLLDSVPSTEWISEGIREHGKTPRFRMTGPRTFFGSLSSLHPRLMTAPDHKPLSPNHFQ